MRATDFIQAKYYVVLGLTLCLGVACFLMFPPYSTDDSYITYRYAYNLFHHNQFAFNLGERILGTTSPFYTLILTGAQLVSDNIPQMSNFISCISASLAGFFLFLILKKDSLPVGIFCALCYPFILQDIGLETNVLIFLFALSLYLFDRDHFLSCSAILGLCFLTRQDSAIFILCMTIIYWLKIRKMPWRELIVLSAVIAPWFMFSSVYFGSLFPTSLEAKRGYADCTDYFINAFSYLVRYCDRYNFYLFSLVSQKLTHLLPAAYFSSRVSQPCSLIILYLPVILSGMLYHLKNIGKRSPLRLLFFIYPLAMIIALSLIAPPPTHRWHLTSAIHFALIGQLTLFTNPLLSAIKKKKGSFSRSALLKTSLTAFLVLYVLFFFVSNAKDFYTMSHHADQSFWFGARFHNYKTIGLFLRDHVSDEESVFVLEVGTIGYYSRKRMIDGAGLISPGYGRYHREGCWLLGIKKEFPDYIATWDMDIPHYEPVFHSQNIFGKMVVHKKSKSLPCHNYPFSQLLHNWKKWKDTRTRGKKGVP